jgi:hypothetical protein
LATTDKGFTPIQRFQGQCVLNFLPLSIHESSVLLAAPNRSGLRSSFPARPIRCSAFRPWSASIALPTAWPTMPSADFCAAIRSPRGSLSSELGTATQISPGKFDRLPRIPAGSTASALDGYGLRETSPARPAKDASHPISIRQVAVLLRTAFRRRLAVAALVLR